MIPNTPSSPRFPALDQATLPDFAHFSLPPSSREHIGPFAGQYLYFAVRHQEPESWTVASKIVEAVNGGRFSRITLYIELVGGDTQLRSHIERSFNKDISEPRNIRERKRAGEVSSISSLAKMGFHELAQIEAFLANIKDTLNDLRESNGIKVRIILIDASEEDGNILKLQAEVEAANEAFGKLIRVPLSSFSNPKKQVLEALRNGITKAAFAIRARNNLISEQLKAHFANSAEDELNVIVTGGTHIELSRGVTLQGGKRIGVSASPGVLEYLPKLFKNAHCLGGYDLLVQKVLARGALSEHDLKNSIIRQGIYTVLGQRLEHFTSSLPERLRWVVSPPVIELVSGEIVQSLGEKEILARFESLFEESYKISESWISRSLKRVIQGGKGTSARDVYTFKNALDRESKRILSDLNLFATTSTEAVQIAETISNKFVSKKGSNQS